MKGNADMQRAGLPGRPLRWVKPHNINERNDQELAIAAVNAIECLTTVPLDMLRVTARNGFLHLEGTVSGEHQRTILEEVTRPLAGVLGVVDSIRVQDAA
jgi:hypothetical protein